MELVYHYLSMSESDGMNPEIGRLKRGLPQRPENPVGETATLSASSERPHANLSANDLSLRIIVGSPEDRESYKGEVLARLEELSEKLGLRSIEDLKHRVSLAHDEYSERRDRGDGAGAPLAAERALQEMIPRLKEDPEAAKFLGDVTTVGSMWHMVQPEESKDRPSEEKKAPDVPNNDIHSEATLGPSEQKKDDKRNGDLDGGGNPNANNGGKGGSGRSELLVTEEVRPAWGGEVKLRGVSGRTSLLEEQEKAAGLEPGTWLFEQGEARLVENKNLLRRLEPGQLREILVGDADPVVKDVAKEVWFDEVSQVGKVYRRVTGESVEDFVLRRVSGRSEKPAVTAQEKDLEEKEEEFNRYLKKNKRAAEVINGIVEDEERALKTKEEVPWRDAVISEEVWQHRDDVSRRAGRNISGVKIIDTKPIYEMSQEERETEFGRRASEVFKQEQDKAESERKQIDLENIKKQTSTWATLLGVAVMADELGEFVEDLAKHGGPKNPNLLREFREWKEARKTKQSVPEPDKPKPEPESEPKKQQEENKVDPEKEMREKIYNMSPRQLQIEISRTDSNYPLELLKAEKKRRLDDLVKYSEEHGQGDLVKYVRDRLNGVLEVSFPNNFRGPLEDYRDNFSHTEPIDDTRHRGMRQIWVEDEVNNLLLQIYSDTKDPAIIASASIPGVNIQMDLKSRNERSRVDMGVFISNPVGRLQRVPATRAQWEAMVQGWPFSQEVKASMGRYYDEKERIEREEEEARRRAAQPPPQVPASQENGGNKYKPDQAIRLIIDKNWREPTTVVDQDTMAKTIGDMKENPQYKELAEMMEKIMKLNEFVPSNTTPMSEWVKKFAEIDVWTLTSLIGNEDLNVGISCSARKLGVVRRGDGSLTYDAQKLERYKRLTTGEKPDFGTEIRRDIAKEMKIANPEDPKVWMVFIYGYNFLKMCGLPAVLVREYVGVDPSGNIQENPGYFHPDVNRQMWEAAYSEIAVKEVSKRSATAQVANGQFIKQLQHNRADSTYRIAGVPVYEALSSPFRFDSFTASKGVFRSKQALLSRIMEGGKISVAEMENTPTLAQMKVNAVTSEWRAMVMESEKQLLVNEPEKNLIFRTPFALKMAEKIIRQLDDMDQLSGDLANVNERVSEVFSRMLLIRLGLDSTGTLVSQNELSATILAEIFRHPFRYFDPKKDKEFTIDVRGLAGWIGSHGRTLNPKKDLLTRSANADYIRKSAINWFKKSSHAQNYVRRAVWGDINAMSESFSEVEGMVKWVEYNNNKPDERKFAIELNNFNGAVLG